MGIGDLIDLASFSSDAEFNNNVCFCVISNRQLRSVVIRTRTIMCG